MKLSFLLTCYGLFFLFLDIRSINSTTEIKGNATVENSGMADVIPARAKKSVKKFAEKFIN